MLEPLRIAFLDSWRRANFDGSGTAAAISGLALALRQLGHQVDLIRPDSGAGHPASRLAFNLGLLARMRSAEPYGLVVGCDLDGFHWASKRERTLPYIVCLKGIAADEARFSRSSTERILLSGMAWLERRNARYADRVLVPSRYSAEVAQAMYRLPPDRIGIVPEAVDLGPWEEPPPNDGARYPAPPETRSQFRNAPYILSVARQYPRKDTETLLRAMPRILRKRPDTKLLVIGGGPELPHLQALAGELGLGSAVELRGEVEDDREVQRAFRTADVFCLPSRQEGFGIAFVEAMAAGLPVVAARAGAVPELVEHGTTGLLVTSRDPDAVAAALIALLGDEELRRRMGEAGKHRARRYDLEPVGRQFIAEVESLLTGRPPVAPFPPRAATARS